MIARAAARADDRQERQRQQEAERKQQQEEAEQIRRKKSEHLAREKALALADDVQRQTDAELQRQAGVSIFFVGFVIFSFCFVGVVLVFLWGLTGPATQVRCLT